MRATQSWVGKEQHGMGPARVGWHPPHMTSLRQVEGVWLVQACFWAHPMKTDLDTLAVIGIRSLPLPALGDSHKLSSASTNRYSIKEEYLLGAERTSELWVQMISFLPQNGAIKEPLNSFIRFPCGYHFSTQLTLDSFCYKTCLTLRGHGVSKPPRQKINPLQRCNHWHLPQPSGTRFEGRESGMRPFVELSRKFHTSDLWSDPQYLKSLIKTWLH